MQEFFCDVYAVSHDLFALNQNSNIGMCMNNGRWSAYEESIFARHVEGVLSVLLSLQCIDKNRPVVRYA